MGCGKHTVGVLHLPSSNISPRIKTISGRRSHRAVWKPLSICHSLNPGHTCLKVSTVIVYQAGMWRAPGDGVKQHRHFRAVYMISNSIPWYHGIDVGHKVLPPQFVEPVSPHGSQQMGIRQHHCAERGAGGPAVGHLSPAHSAELWPGAAQDHRVVDEVLAEKEHAD